MLLMVDFVVCYNSYIIITIKINNLINNHVALTNYFNSWLSVSILIPWVCTVNTFHYNFRMHIHYVKISHEIEILFPGKPQSFSIFFFFFHSSICFFLWFFLEDFRHILVKVVWTLGLRGLQAILGVLKIWYIFIGGIFALSQKKKKKIEN